MNMILAFEKDALNAMRQELTRLHKSVAKPAHKGAHHAPDRLHQVRFDEFCSVLLDRIMEKDEKCLCDAEFFSSIEFTSAVRSIAQYFDAVDVDRRGVVSWSDFTNFCLRIGRMRFKPSMKGAVTKYAQVHHNKMVHFPTYRVVYHPHDEAMYAFDVDSPIVRIYRAGKYQGKLNPVAELKRSLKLLNTGLTYFNQKKQDKESFTTKNTWRDLDPTKSSIVSMVYVPSTREIAISTSGAYLIWVEASYPLNEEDGLKIVKHVKVDFPHSGGMYSAPLDMLILWTGEASDHLFEIWEPVTHALRFKVKKHEYKILSVCEMVLDADHPLSSHFIASSSMDKRVLLWPTSPLACKSRRSTNMIRTAETLGYELRGHSHAIMSLVYAPQHEMLIGAGFDFEIFGWDPFTRDVCMKFVGHFKCIFGVQIALIPTEKLLSLDESGVLKVWNIDKDLGLFGEQEQSMRIQLPSTSRIRDFKAVWNNGASLVVQADSTYMLEMESEAPDDQRPVPGGLGLCETSGTLWCMTRKSITIVSLLNGAVRKRLAFLDQERISSKELLHTDGKRDVSYIDPRDVITAVAQDASGRKVFLGTNDGRVLLFDTFTFGLLLQLTDEKDAFFLQQGAVVGLDYVDRDELVVAVYSNGAVKVLVGCHRTVTGGNPSMWSEEEEEEEECVPVTTLGNLDLDPFQLGGSSRSVSAKLGAVERSAYPGSGGGQPPSSQFLLREVDLGAVYDNSICGSSVSSDHNLIAACTKKGQVFVYNYLDMALLAVLKIPAFEGAEAVCTKIAFAPLVPVLLATDSCGRVTAWSVRPMKFAWLHTFSVYHHVSYEGGGAEKMRNSSVGRAASMSTTNTSASAAAAAAMHGVPRKSPGRAESEKSGKKSDDAQRQTRFEGAKPEKVEEGEIGRNRTGASQPQVQKKIGWASRGTFRHTSQFDVALPSSGMQLTCLRVVQWLDKSPAAPAHTLAKTVSLLTHKVAPAHAPMGHAPPLGHALLLRAQVRRARALMKSSNQAYDSPPASDSDPDSDSSDGSQREAHVVKRQWNVIVGDEGGNVMVLNLTRLMEKCNAVNQLPRPEAHFAVYTRQKPIRIQPLFKYEGAPTPPLDPEKLSAELLHMIEHPIGQDVLLAPITVDQASFKSGSPKPRRSGHSGQTGLLLRYAEGLRKWSPCPGHPIRAICTVDLHPHKQAKQSQSAKQSDLWARNAHASVKRRSEVTEEHPDSHQAELPPTVIFVASEIGTVMQYTWGGFYLGQQQEESLDPRKTNQEMEEDLYGERALKLAAQAQLAQQETLRFTLAQSVKTTPNRFPGATAAVAAANAFGTSASVRMQKVTLGGVGKGKSMKGSKGKSRFATATASSSASTKGKGAMGSGAETGRPQGVGDCPVLSFATHREKEKVLVEVEVEAGVPIVRGEAVASFLDLSLLKTQSRRGWRYPHMSVCVRPFRAAETDARIYQLSDIQHYAIRQYHHHSAVLQWVLPQLRRTLPLYLSLHADKCWVTSRQAFAAPSAEHGDYTLNRITSYKTFNQSTVDLLKNLNSFIERRDGPKETEPAVDLEHPASDSDHAVVPRQNMHGLIDYIQDNRYFDSQLKNGESLFLRLSNLELEQSRKLDKSKKGKSLKMLPIAPFDRNHITGELEDEFRGMSMRVRNGGKGGSMRSVGGAKVVGVVGVVGSVSVDQESTVLLSLGASFRVEAEIAAQQTLEASVRDMRGIAFDEVLARGVDDLELGLGLGSQGSSLGGSLADDDGADGVFLTSFAGKYSSSLDDDSAPLLAHQHSRGVGLTSVGGSSGRPTSRSRARPTSAPSAQYSAPSTQPITPKPAQMPRSNLITVRSGAGSRSSYRPSSRPSSRSASPSAGGAAGAGYSYRDMLPDVSRPSTAPAPSPSGMAGVGRESRETLRTMSASAARKRRNQHSAVRMDVIISQLESIGALDTGVTGDGDGDGDEVLFTDIPSEGATDLSEGGNGDSAMPALPDFAVSPLSPTSKFRRAASTSALSPSGISVPGMNRAVSFGSLFTRRLAAEYSAQGQGPNSPLREARAQEDSRQASDSPTVALPLPLPLPLPLSASIPSVTMTQGEEVGESEAKGHVRIGEILSKYSKFTELDRAVKYFSYDPFRTTSNKQATTKRKNNTGPGRAGGYISNASEFPDIVDMAREDTRQQAKKNAKTAAGFDSTFYGPYRSKMLFMYISWARTLKPLSAEESVALNPHIGTDVMLDQGAYFEGQQRYEFKSLLEESADEAFQHLFVTPLRSLAHSYQHLIITEACLQSSVFEGTQPFERTRIYMFIKLARMFFGMMEAASPATEVKTGQRSATGSKKIASAKAKAVKDDMSSEGEVEETDYIGGRYLVRPHPLRGFRHWAVSRKMLASLTRYVESWASSEQGPLLVSEFVEIIQATVPRADLDRHRQLRFDLSLPRVGLRMNMDLTAEGVQKILDHVLELKSSA